jgi:AraC-like DNA-binding protein
VATLDRSFCLLRHVPRPPLSRYVDCLWYSARYTAPHSFEKLLPTGSVDLVIRLDDAPIRIFDDQVRRQFECNHAVVHGAHSGPCVIATQQQSSVLGVHFRPGGAAAFFRQPFGELANRSVAAEDVWGRQIHELRERLLEAALPRAMFELLEDALMRRLVPPPDQLRSILWARDQFVANPTVGSVQAVRDHSGYSPKQFIRHFENYVGLTPKLFCRVLRFQAVLEELAVRRAVHWANIALDCGYFDQSHLIRDFRQFSGICPSEYEPADPDRRNHVAVRR